MSATVLHAVHDRGGHFVCLERQRRTEVIRAIGVFCAAYHGNTLKLMQEVGLRWPDATAAEVDAAMGAAACFLHGDAGE
jgi:hypothetical protein